MHTVFVSLYGGTNNEVAPIYSITYVDQTYISGDVREVLHVFHLLSGMFLIKLPIKCNVVSGWWYSDF